MFNSVLTKKQVLKIPSKKIKYYGEDSYISPVIRYDDECGNGHNTFAITATIRNRYGVWLAGGCLHDEIAEAYPEYAHLIKWHLCSSDGPLYYVENTLYHASDSTSLKYKAGEPNKWNKVLKFKNSNITHEFDSGFIEFLELNKTCKDFKVVEIQHRPTEDYQYNPHYTFEHYHNIEWWQCPFKTKEKAEEYAKELNTKKWTIKKIVTGYQESKERNFDAARASAIWFDATDEELSLDSKELKKLLLKRLPKLMKEFKKDIEKLGFIY